MLSYSGITGLSFANKVVKVQPKKFFRSSYGVPRTLQYQTILFLFSTTIFHDNIQKENPFTFSIQKKKN